MRERIAVGWDRPAASGHGSVELDRGIDEAVGDHVFRLDVRIGPLVQPLLHDAVDLGDAIHVEIAECVVGAVAHRADLHQPLDR